VVAVTDEEFREHHFGCVQEVLGTCVLGCECPCHLEEVADDV
jgi:hypothetical protein